MTQWAGVARVRHLCVCVGACLVAAAGGARARNVYVSPKGDDAWSGRAAAPNADRRDGPVRTLRRAAELTRPGDVCFLRGGVYRRTLRPSASGTADRPITFRAYQGERAVLSGADPVRGWKKAKDGVWTAPVAWDIEDGNQVFAGDEPLTEARWPNNTPALLRPVRARVQSGSANTVTDAKLPGGDGAWRGALLWCAGGAEWICWTARVTGYDAATHTLTFDKKQTRRFYTPRKNNPYVLMGVRFALDAGGEWWFDAKGRRLHLRPLGGKDPRALGVEMKRRLDAIDLSGRSHVRVVGLCVHAAGIRTDEQSSDIVLDGVRARYVAHSYEKDTSGRSGVLVRGRRIELRNCELAYASGSIVDVRGSDHRVVNCYIHHGNYAAKWRGPLALAGRRHVIAYNTVRHSGRDLVNVHGLSESLIEYNDFSDAGWLTSDLGLIYGHNTDFANTVIRRNLAHDNHAPACSMGIYFDHLSHNVIVHHNAVWNVGRDPIRINNPSYCNLVYHNTCWNIGAVGTFDHARRNDLFATRYVNNILNAPVRLPKQVAVEHNLIERKPALADAAKGDFSLKPGSKARDAGAAIEGLTAGVTDGRPDIGALEYPSKPWRAGHDFDNPPQRPVELKRPRIGYMNLVQNACFERAALEAWTKAGAGRAALVAGNGWGVAGFGRTRKTQPTGTSKRELRLGGGADGVEQRIDGLHPNTAYTLSGWLRVSSGAESAALGVRDFGGTEAHASTNSTGWVRRSVRFQTGPGHTRCVIYVRKTSPGAGHAWADNLCLPLTPRGQ